MSLRQIVTRKKKHFTTIYTLNLIKDFTTAQLVELVFKETDTKLRDGFDYNKRYIAKTRMKVLSILNSSDRKVFNDLTTVNFTK